MNLSGKWYMEQVTLLMLPTVGFPIMMAMLGVIEEQFNRLQSTWLWCKAFNLPGSVRAHVLYPVVQAALPSLPELEFIRLNGITAPIGRFGEHALVLKFSPYLIEAHFQLPHVFDHFALGGCPCADLRLPGTALEILF